MARIGYGTANPNRVDIVNIQEGFFEKTLNAGTAPSYVAVSPGGVAVITNEGDNSVSFYNYDQSAGSLTGFQQPQGVAIVSRGTTELAFVANQLGGVGQNGFVSIIRLLPGENPAGVPNTIPVVSSSQFNLPTGVAATPDGEFVFVTNNGNNTVSTINTSSFSTVGNAVSTGIHPLGISVGPSIGTASDPMYLVFVANQGGSVSVYLFNNNSATLSPFKTLTSPSLPSPTGVAVTPDGTKAYVTNINNNIVGVLNVKTNPLDVSVSTFPPIQVGTRTFGVAITPDGAQVWVTNLGKTGPGTISIINTGTDRVIQTLFPPEIASPKGVAFNAGGAAYVTNNLDNDVFFYTLIEVTDLGTIPVGTNLQGIALTPNGYYAYAANENSNTVSVINTRTNTVITTIQVGVAPFDVAILPDGSRVYVTNSGSNTVSVIDTVTNRVIDTLVVGQNPLGIGVTPVKINNSYYVFVANNDSNSVSAINASTNIVSPVSSNSFNGPFGVAVATSGTKVWVTNSSNASVSIIDTNTLQVSNTIATHFPSPRAIAIFDDVAYVAERGPSTNSPSFIEVFNTITESSTGRLIQLANANYNFITFAPQGRFAFVMGPNTDTLIVNVRNEGVISPTIPLNDLAISLGVNTCAQVAPQGVIGAPPNCDYCSGFTGCPTGSTCAKFLSNCTNGCIKNVHLNTSNTDATQSLSFDLCTLGGCLNGSFETWTLTWDNLGNLFGFTGSQFPFLDTYVAANADNLVSNIQIEVGTSNVLDTVTGQITTPSPYGVAYSPDVNREKVLVTNEGSNTVSVIQHATNQIVDTISVGNNPQGIVTVQVNGQNLAYVANRDSNSVSVIDIEQGMVIKTIFGLANPSPVAVGVTNNEPFVYVGNQGGESTVSVIDTADNTIVSSIFIGSTPEGIAVTPDGRHLYVTSASNNAYVVDISDPRNPMIVATIPNLNGPKGVTISPDGSQAYVASLNGVKVINTTTNTVTTTIPLPEGANGIGVTVVMAPATAAAKYYVLVTTSANEVVVIDNTNTIIDSFPVGVNPIGIASILNNNSVTHPFMITEEVDNGRLNTGGQRDLIVDFRYSLNTDGDFILKITDPTTGLDTLFFFLTVNGNIGGFSTININPC